MNKFLPPVIFIDLLFSLNGVDIQFAPEIDEMSTLLPTCITFTKGSILENLL